MTSHPTYDDVNGPDLPYAAVDPPPYGRSNCIPQSVGTYVAHRSTPPPPKAPPPEKEDRDVDALAVGLLELSQLGRPLHTEVDLIVFRFLYTTRAVFSNK